MGEFKSNNFLNREYVNKLQKLIIKRISKESTVDQFTGKYYSTAWIQKNVLHQTEEDIEQITKEIEDEIEDGDDGAYNDDEEEGGDEQPF